jgi:hypothetical protein
MKIIFEENQIDCIASDDADGKFYLSADGCILYRGPGESDPWYVNSSSSRFRNSVKAYEKYVAEVIVKDTEEEQLEVVAKFREAVLAIESYDGQNKSFWLCIAQQAKEGQK